MTKPHAFHPTILREYDIRGTVGKTLFAADAKAIGRSFGTLVLDAGGRTVCVGRDGRLSSPELEEALLRGLSNCGLTVRRIGLGPSPLLYFACRHLDADAGIMVTGSHNPPDHNGFKMLLKGKPFFAEQISRLGRLAAAGETRRLDIIPGQVIETPLQNAYIARLLQDFRPGRDLSIVWDAGNGAAGEAMEMLAARLPGRHILLNSVIDGHFPAHHPDPTQPENMEQLRRTVLAERADFGIAFDGDGDRIGLVDGDGHILWGDQMLMLLAEEVLAEHPGAVILADIKSSQALFDRIAALGGQAGMCPTGHSVIKSRLSETGALLAGEMSGHLFFADRYFGYDDALYAAVRILSMVARWPLDQTLARRHAALPRLHSTPELRIPCADEEKHSKVSALKARLAAEGADVIDIDGVRVVGDDGWWLLRASNTQPCLVARCESATPEGLERLKRQLEHALG
ncbi:MAG TPA: phosphomannomutase/phosphoglucomutase [Candidatus Sulfotelmatobacter sp.]|jgi:phosphomannomutase|nr:phosphomannomutase/phosphoglucomutase [Candidatus Sulfotelmatobacter sp.]